CLENSAKCNGTVECKDGSDEKDCFHKCQDNQFQCANDQCVDINNKCDGANDCGDGSDEQNCCHLEYFKCLTTGKCLPPQHLCDGTPDCSDPGIFDNSDESQC
ncbi:hypothetical protein HELRODRAFT_145809, partial [Helobdella robusta]|uniref:Uncharacterized protein n=1 Tax=Helobdella robusta TaxID=6412 RepID=T1EJN1_HELRO